MKGFSLVEGAQRREFADVVWQIADKRGCDEVAIRYDCGHALRADVFAPTLPKTREYGVDGAERRRFMQHSIFVMTREPGAPRVQITVPEGFCRLCTRGQRQTLICGPLQMDLTDEPAGARRVELPLSSHAFLAVMGQVCRLPEGISTPPIPQGKDGSLKPFDGPALPREGLRQWTRHEVEDALSTEVFRYIGCAMAFLFVLGCQLLYFLRVQFASPTPAFAGDSSFAGIEFMGVGSELRNIATIGGFEQKIVNSTWVLSALTVAVHKAFAPDISLGTEDSATVSRFWSWFVHPLWVALATVLVPVACAADVVVALVMRIAYTFTKDAMWRPAAWVAVDIAKWSLSSLVVCIQTFIIRPVVVLSQMPILNPMIVAVLLSLLVAAVSAPQPPSLSIPSLWSELPNFDFASSLKRAAGRSKCLAPVVNYFKAFWNRKESRAKGGRTGTTAVRGGGRAAGGRGGETGPGRPEKDGKATAAPQPSAPPCCVCLDRPSRYILQPCDHRVVCGECAVQLVEAAARNRSMSEGTGGGGACPSCGMAISRAMRLFS